MKCIGIIGAMEQEVAKIKEKMQEFLHFFVKYVKKIDLLSKKT